MLARILELRGYEVALAQDGQEALDYLHAGQPAALIILDLRMPIMDGWTVLRRLQDDADLADIPVIAFSANVQGDVPGAAATISKGSFDPNVLFAMIDELCHRG